MSSLRRMLSLDCADNIPLPLHSPTRRELARHHSLPARSFFHPRGLHSLPPLTSSRFSESCHGCCCHRPFCFAQKRDSPVSRFASFGSLPAWSADNELDSGSITITRPASRKENLRTEDSVVYKEMCDSIRSLEAPSRYAQVLNSEGVLGSIHTHVQIALYEEEKKKVEPSCMDVKRRPLTLHRLKRSVSVKSTDLEEGMLMEFSASRSNNEARDHLLHDMGGSVNSAISSLVYMMESLQQHTMWLRRVLMREADAYLHGMMLRVHQEMQETFLWLFQEVFACTPKLMLLTMMLLVDFAVHSMGEHVALGLMPMGEPPTCAIESNAATTHSSFHCTNMSSNRTGSTNAKVHEVSSKLLQESLAEPRLCTGGAGDKVVRIVKVGGSMDGEAVPTVSADGAAMTAEDDTRGRLMDASCCEQRIGLVDEGYFEPGAGSYSGDDNEEHRKLSAMWQQAVSKDPNLRLLTRTGHVLVAPVQAPALEADDYACYDRTDLKYQHELSRDPSNPLLLANYAQFLHVVRHDHDRAEVLYKRAVKADPVDGELIGKYASFLWVAKEDVEAADEAYKSALAVDPTNVYHAGSYAHFLWTSSPGMEDLSSNTATYQQVSTS